MAYRDEVLLDTPINYWEMNTATGTDSGSANRTLTLNGGVSTGLAGKVGNAWGFDIGKYGSTNEQAIGSSYTIETWVKVPTVTQGTDRIIEWLNPLVCFYIAGDYPGSGAQRGKVGCHISGSEVYSTVRVDDDTWHHVAYVVSGSSISIYIDGNLNTTGTITNTGGMAAKSITVGSSAPTVTADFMIGNMDELAVYNYALSGTRIKAHYDAANVVPVGPLDLTTGVTGRLEYRGVPNTRISFVKNLVTGPAAVIEYVGAGATLSFVAPEVPVIINLDARMARGLNMAVMSKAETDTRMARAVESINMKEIG